jgi:hypothetical protein
MDPGEMITSKIKLRERVQLISVILSERHRFLKVNNPTSINYNKTTLYYYDFKFALARKRKTSYVFPKRSPKHYRGWRKTDRRECDTPILA